MNKKLTVFFFIVFYSFMCIHVNAQVKKYAYLLGIEEYCATSGLSSLQSVDNDLFYMKAALEAQGFDCVTFNASDASKAEILNSLNKHLSSRVKSKDIALFYFTGHGMQVENLDMDECDEADGLDEAIVLSNYSSTAVNKDQLILDDEIDDFFNPVRRRLGPNGQLILIFDACHSGSLSRSMSTKQNSYLRQEEQDLGMLSSMSFSDCLNDNLNPDIAPIVGMYSSLDDEQSFEFGGDEQKFGVFTYSLIERLKTCHIDYSYGDWLSQTRLFMEDKFQNQQIPVSEGAVDQLIWKNGVSKTSMKQGSAANGLLGTVLSPSITIPRGSDLAIYPKGTVDTMGLKPRVILKADEYTLEGGTVSILPSAKKTFQDGDMLFFPPRKKEVLPLKLFFSSKEYEVLEELADLLDEQLFIELTDNPEYAQLHLKRSEKDLVLSTKAGKELSKRESFDDYSHKSLYRYFREALVHFNNSIHLSSLEGLSSGIDVSWSIQKLKDGALSDKEEVVELVVGDTFDLSFTNNESNQIFAYLFHQDEGYALTALPLRKEVLTPGGRVRLANRYVVTGPIGTDTFTLILSRTKILNEAYSIAADGDAFSFDYFFTSLKNNQPIMFAVDQYLPQDLIQVERKNLRIVMRD